MLGRSVTWRGGPRHISLGQRPRFGVTPGRVGCGNTWRNRKREPTVSKRAFLPSLLLGVLVLASGCVSGGGVGDPAEFNRTMGRVSAVDLAEGVDKIFQKFKLTILREESTYSLIYYETEWMMREPHPSEQAQGATQARERIILEGRRSGDYARVEFTGECELLVSGADGWQRPAISDPARQHFQRIYSDLEMETRAGIITRSTKKSPGPRGFSRSQWSCGLIAPGASLAGSHPPPRRSPDSGFARSSDRGSGPAPRRIPKEGSRFPGRTRAGRSAHRTPG